MTIVSCTRFGASPEGERLKTIEQSPHYSNGEFYNIEPTTVLIEGESKWGIMWDNMVNPGENLSPEQKVPTKKTDLRQLPANEDSVVWLGHSSYFLKLSTLNILLDPVMSDYASPIPGVIKAFNGTSNYSVADLPDIDLLFISHDHWDHLDYNTISSLKGRVKRFIVPLGVGAHLSEWGVQPERIIERDWFGEYKISDDVTSYIVPSRHYSGRAFSQNKTLWGGIVFSTSKRKLFFSGDSGYGSHFKEIAKRYGPFDLVALDMGQYDPRWPDIHMTPAQAAMTAAELNTKALLPAHVARFSLAQHAWNQPLDQIITESKKYDYRILTPEIGERVRLDDISIQAFYRWWD